MNALIFNIQKFSLHDGAGIRTDVFFQGCNLNCKWCSNPESQSMKAKAPYSARTYSVDELISELIKDKAFYDKSGGGVTLTGGEALLQHEFLSELCPALHKLGIHVALETAANVPTEIFERVLNKIDMAHIDLKHYDPQAHKRGTGVSNELILKNITTALKREIPVIIRIPVIPGFNDSVSNARSFARLLCEIKAHEIQILPFHQFGESKYQKMQLPYAYSGIGQLHDEDLNSFADILRSSGLSVQIGG